MTKEELYNYIDELEKPYSEDTLLDIGIKFRQLPLKDRSWKELVDYLDIDRSANGFRQWIYRNEKANECASIERECTAIDEDSNYVDEYKNITRNRDILNSYRRLIRDEARVDSLKDAVKETVSHLNSLPDMSYEIDYTYGENEYKNEAVMLVSDMHIGVEIDNCFNKYNHLIAEKRLEKYVNETIKYCSKMNVYRLNIINLGDLIHGLIHTTGRIEEEFDVMQQVMTAAELLAKALNALQMAAPEVVYRSVTDNHSRALANYKENIEKENFYRIIDWYIEERLKGSRIIFDKECNLDPSFAYFKLLNGQTCCAAHGHLDNINTSIQNFSGLTRQVIDNVFLAHYHDEKVKNFQGSTVFVNGSIVGPEQYALSKRLFNYATQKLIIYCEDSRMDISIKLN